MLNYMVYGRKLKTLILVCYQINLFSRPITLPGQSFLVDDKSELNIKETRRLLNKWVRERHGLMSFEPHYWNIEGRIIAEELLENNSFVGLSASLIDYKFWCIHGEPVIIMVLYDRDSMRVGKKVGKEKPQLHAIVYDLNWNPRHELLAGHLAQNEPMDIPRPKNFDEMVAMCKTLSKPFAQVRVDLYEVNDKVYFGELTFTPGGNFGYFTPEFFLKMGGENGSVLSATENKKVYSINGSPTVRTWFNRAVRLERFRCLRFQLHQ
ncbi:MAG: ATP-grasp fold amidoligase family protein [Bacteroidales bacterium]|nr:ATP-grasp fold amidoligase family protein [Bacteroidales bacterium]